MCNSGPGQPKLDYSYNVSRYVIFTSALLLFAVIFAYTCHAAPSYKSLNDEFSALQADKQKSLQREPWEKIKDKFDAFVKANPKSADASKAAFMGARCLEEIAIRSHSSRDFRNAASFLGKVADTYPKSAQAGEALWRKAEIEYKYLKNNAAAKQTLSLLLKKTQDAKLKSKAKGLEDKIKTEAAGAGGQNAAGNSGGNSGGNTSGSASTKQTSSAGNSAGKATDKAAGKAAGKPQANSSDANISEPCLLSILVNADKNKTKASLELNTGAGFAYRFIPKSKSGTGNAALILEVEGVIPKLGIKGLTSVPKGPVRSVNCMQGKLSGSGGGAADSGKGIPSARVEFALSDDYSFTIESDKNSSLIQVTVDSSKKQTGAQAGRGQVGKPSSSTSFASNTATQGATQEDSSSNIQSARESDEIRQTQSASSSSRAESLGLTVKTILLDPGHGGRDPGAKANGVVESKLVMKLSSMVEKRLKKRGFNVSYTRDKDVFIALEKRTETANRRKVDLFISIHVNANTDTSVSGLEVYYLDQARTKSAERVAARENGVSVKAISDLQVIISDLGFNTKMKESRELSGDVLKSMVRQVKSGGFTARSNGVRSAPFYVLMGAKMPSILIELGYLSHKGDAEYLKNDKYLERLADGIVEGIVAYKKRLEKSVS